MPINSKKPDSSKSGKPFYKKWWGITIIVVVILGIGNFLWGGRRARK